jgi:hypothetical protein
MKILNELGLTEEDIKLVSAEDSDLTPVLEKIKGNYFELAKKEPSFIESITEPLKSQVIGKENQYKKLIKNSFGLDLTNEDLAKTDGAKLMELAKQKMQTELSSNETLVAYQNKNTELLSVLQEKEELIESIKNESEQKINSFIKKSQIDKIFLQKLEAESLIKKENILTFKDVLMSLISTSGYILEPNTKGDLELLESNNTPVMRGVKKLTVNEFIKEKVLELSGGLQYVPDDKQGKTTRSLDNKKVDTSSVIFI